MDVHRGHVFSRTQGVPGGGDEHQGSVPCVRSAQRHRAQDALASRATRMPQEAPTHPIDFDEVNDPAEMAADVTDWKFLPNVTHRDCGVFIDVGQKEQSPTVVAIVREAFNVAEE